MPGIAPSTLLTNRRWAVNGGSNHMCTYRGWPNKHPTFQGAIVSAEIIFANNMHGHDDLINILSTYLPTMKHMNGGHRHDGKKLSFMRGVYVNVISTAHGRAPSIMACSLQPRHGSVLGTARKENKRGR